VATRVIEVNDGRVVLYPGGYDDYEAARIARAQGTDGAPVAAAPERAGARTPDGAPRARAGREARPAPRAAAAPKPAREAPARGESREQRSARQRREREIQRIERDLETRETRLREVEGLLADPEVYHHGERARELVAEYERLKAEVDSLWQRMSEL
jgi:ATPase subunit of ABC transporter with duplicated ATPase domains